MENNNQRISQEDTTAPKNIKRKRIKKRPNRKWTLEEETLIISYLESNRDFEKPTSRKYYTQFVKNSGKSDLTWDLVRYKVRNMKLIYFKADNFKKLHQNNSELEISYEGYIYNICPHFDRLDKLFGTQHVDINCATENKNSNQTTYIIKSEIENTIESNSSSELIMDIVASPLELDSLLDTNNLNNNLKPEIAFVSIPPEERNIQKEIYELKYRLKLEKMHKRYDLQEQQKIKKIEFEMKQAKSMEIFEIQQQEEKYKNKRERKFLEIEYQERIELLELELKYQN